MLATAPHGIGSRALVGFAPFRNAARVLCALTLAGSACSQPSATPSATGGHPALGGAVGSGGTVGSGGAGLGGAPGTGGALASGGWPGTGGGAGGGNAGGGGVFGSGGAAGGGGTPTGGEAGLRTGGAPGGGGGTTSASGGASSATGGSITAAGGTIAATGGAVMASGGASAASGGTTTKTGGTGGATAATGGTTGGSGGSRADGGGTGGTIAGTGGGTTVTVNIVPGTVWNDTQGKVIEAHGAGIIKVGDTYYWLGEDKTSGSSFQNVSCYSSVDLKNWVFVNNVLTRQASGDLGPNRVIERPHVIYNAATSQFVMYMHVDSSSYTDRKAGVATGGSVCGAYTYRGSFKPLGHDSLDDTLFQDGNTGYFLSEDRTNAKLQIYQLADDYLTVASLVATLPQYESPAVAKIGGTYFLFGSHLTGWSTNDNQYSTATSMAGPWAAWRSFAPSGTNTCNSQTTFILPVSGGRGTTYVFLGDRWNSNNLADSRYIWQPLTISGTTVSMTCATSWDLDVSVGATSP